MKKINIILLLFLSLSSLIYGQSKPYRLEVKEKFTLDSVFVWKGDTMYKDSILYAQVTTDSVRFKNINGSFTSWFYSPKIFIKNYIFTEINYTPTNSDGAIMFTNTSSGNDTCFLKNIDAGNKIIIRRADITNNVVISADSITQDEIIFAEYCIMSGSVQSIIIMSNGNNKYKILTIGE